MIRRASFEAVKVGTCLAVLGFSLGHWCGFNIRGTLGCGIFSRRRRNVVRDTILSSIKTQKECLPKLDQL